MQIRRNNDVPLDKVLRLFLPSHPHHSLRLGSGWGSRIFTPMQVHASIINIQDLVDNIWGNIISSIVVIVVAVKTIRKTFSPHVRTHVRTYALACHPYRQSVSSSFSHSVSLGRLLESRVFSPQYLKYILIKRSFSWKRRLTTKKVPYEKEYDYGNTDRHIYYRTTYWLASVVADRWMVGWLDV